MKRLYKIWVVVERINGNNWEKPLTEVMDIMPSHWSREDFVSMDIVKLQETTKYLNEIAYRDEHYEVREEKYEPI